MINLLSSLPSIVIALAVTLGGLFAFRRTYTKSLGEIQERLIAAQEKELVRLRRDGVAMRYAFKQLGVEIEIDGDVITIIDGQQAKRKRIIQIPAVEDEDK